MKLLKERMFGNAPPVEVTVKEAIEDSLTDTGYESQGAVEDARQVANNTAAALAVVIEKLVESGSLKIDDLTRVFSHKYSVEND